MAVISEFFSLKKIVLLLFVLNMVFLSSGYTSELEEFDIITSNPSEKELLYVREPRNHFFRDDFSKGSYWWDTEAEVDSETETIKLEGSGFLGGLFGFTSSDSGSMTLDTDYDGISEYDNLNMHISVDSGGTLGVEYYDGSWNEVDTQSVSDQETAVFDMSGISDIEDIRVSNEGRYDLSVDEVRIEGGLFTEKTFRMDEPPEEVTVMHEGVRYVYRYDGEDFVTDSEPETDSETTEQSSELSYLEYETISSDGTENEEIITIDSDSGLDSYGIDRDVNFDEERVVIIGRGQKNEGGYSINVDDVYTSGGDVALDFYEEEPDPSDITSQAFYYLSKTLLVNTGGSDIVVNEIQN